MAPQPIFISARYGRLVVIAKADPVAKGRKMAARWQCQCDCGTIRDFRADDLRSGNSTSCGCKRRETMRANKTTHGRSDDVIYKSWVQMKQRCFNPNDDKFPDYGARGISVCDEWRDSFEAFAAHMGPRPAGHSLDRINNDGSYEPGNCRWAPLAVQSRNRRDNIWVEHNGVRMVAADFAELLGISSKRLYKVMSSQGLPPKEAAEYVIQHRRS